MFDQVWADDFVQRSVESFNRRDWDAWVATTAPTFHFWSPVLETTDVFEVLDNYKRVVAAIPDLHISIRQYIWRPETRTLVTEQEEKGNNTGSFASALGVLPATGGAFHMRNVLVSEITNDGLVTDVREYFDLLGVMRQLGAM